MSIWTLNQWSKLFISFHMILIEIQILSFVFWLSFASPPAIDRCLGSMSLTSAFTTCTSLSNIGRDRFIFFCLTLSYFVLLNLLLQLGGVLIFFDELQIQFWTRNFRVFYKSLNVLQHFLIKLFLFLNWLTFLFLLITSQFGESTLNLFKHYYNL